MGNLIVNAKTFDELAKKAEFLRSYVVSKEDDTLIREFLSHLASLTYCKKPEESRPADEPTVTIAVSELVRMQEEIAKIETLRAAVVSALVDLHSFVPESTDSPFVSEDYLYEQLGKDDARSVLHKIRQIGEAAGIEDYHFDVVVPANQIINHILRFCVDIEFPNDDNLADFIKELREYIQKNRTDGMNIPSMTNVVDHQGERDERGRLPRIPGRGFFRVDSFFKNIIDETLKKPEYSDAKVVSERHYFET